jgi:hypothetical protein
MLLHNLSVQARGSTPTYCGIAQAEALNMQSVAELVSRTIALWQQLAFIGGYLRGRQPGHTSIQASQCTRTHCSLDTTLNPTP